MLKADDALLHAKDAALRQSFYRRFNPSTYKNWPEFVADGEVFFNGTLRNDNIWRKEETREVIGRLCWDHPDPKSNMDMPRMYNGIEEHMQKKHPEWFV